MVTLLAVHISDNVLHLPWLLGGFAVAVVLALVGELAHPR